jgi:hypothetical protein
MQDRVQIFFEQYILGFVNWIDSIRPYTNEFWTQDLKEYVFEKFKTASEKFNNRDVIPYYGGEPNLQTMEKTVDDNYKSCFRQFLSRNVSFPLQQVGRTGFKTKKGVILLGCELCDNKAAYKCEKCETQYYCNEKCAEKDWKQGHRHMCGN